jgi:hypothetical protein
VLVDAPSWQDHFSSGAASMRSSSGAAASVDPDRHAPVKVLFVAGAARSGTTLVDLLLGQIRDVTTVGELRFLWQRGLREGRLCGCGRRVTVCDFWARTLDAARIGPAADPAHMATRLSMVERPRFILDTFRERPNRDPAAQQLADQLGEVYRAVVEESGASIVVDSSKPPTYGRLLQMAPKIDLRVLHLTRDPRACAFSLQRNKPARDRPEGGSMRRQPPWKAALTWNLWNLAAERLASPDPSKYLRMRYLDLVTAPNDELARIAKFVGIDENDATRAMTDGAIELGTNHSVAGNPVRLESRLEIQPDLEWTQRLDPKDRRIVEAITRPVMARYGYDRRTPTASVAR